MAVTKTLNIVYSTGYGDSDDGSHPFQISIYRQQQAKGSLKSKTTTVKVMELNK
jgi:hypothetical protein